MHSGQSARHAPMWPGFDYGPAGAIWLSPCSDGFYPGSPVFDQDRGAT